MNENSGLKLTVPKRVFYKMVLDSEDSIKVPALPYNHAVVCVKCGEIMKLVEITNVVAVKHIQAAHCDVYECPKCHAKIAYTADRMLY